MVKSVENGTSFAPFLVKCYEMVNDESTNELISWCESNDSFIIWDESKFSSQLLPKYFKHSNFASFVRQLNIYGFRKIDTDHWQFGNDYFIKGQKHLLKNIVRRKHTQNLVQKKTSQDKDTDPVLQSEEEKRIALWKEVESLKTDKITLTQELKKLRQNQQTSQSKLVILREQLKGMEKNQQQMLSFVVMAMQSPEFMAQFFPSKNNSWRMAETVNTKLSDVTEDCELTPSDGMIVMHQPPQDALPQPPCTTGASENENLMEFDFSSAEMREILMDIDFLLGPMDEGLLPLENHGQRVHPDILINDTMLDELLLSDPSMGNGLHTGLEGESHIGSRVQSGGTCQPNESNESNGVADDVDENQNQITEDKKIQSAGDCSEKVEVLTNQMKSLNSEIRSNH